MSEQKHDAIAKDNFTAKIIGAIVIDRVSKHYLDETDMNEITAFERMKSGFLAQYAEQYVAIYQGRVVAHGDEKLPLIDQVREQFGHVVFYIEKVAPNSPRTVRMSSFRVQET